MNIIEENNVVYSATTTAITDNGESDDVDIDGGLRQRRSGLCGCANSRLGLLAVALTELVSPPDHN